MSDQERRGQEPEREQEQTTPTQGVEEPESRMPKPPKTGAEEVGAIFRKLGGRLRALFRPLGENLREVWRPREKKPDTSAGTRGTRLRGAGGKLVDRLPPRLRRWTHSVREGEPAYRWEQLFPVACFAAAFLLYVLMILILYVPGAPVPAGVKIEVVSEDTFLDDGVFVLDGLQGFGAGYIRENLRMQPATPFTVKKHWDGKVRVTLEKIRNVGYTGHFQVGADSGGSGYEVTFAVNGPPLTVKLGQGSAITQRDSVELIFSEQVDIYSLADSLKIEPRTAYSLQYDLNRVTITPDVEWVVTNNYQVSIGAGYMSKTGRQFADSQVLSFKVSAPGGAIHVADAFGYEVDEFGYYIDEYGEYRLYEEDYPVSASRSAHVSFRSGSNFVIDEEGDMTLLFYGENLGRGVPVLVETWAMDSLEKYRDQGHIYLDYDIAMDSLRKLDTNAFLIGPGENSFAVPAFGPGSYLLSATYDDPLTGEEIQVRTSYFVTPLSVYLQSSGRDTVVWLNSADGSAPLAGHRVEFSGDHGGVTDGSGILVLPHADGADLSSFSVFDPEGALVYFDDTSLYVRESFYERYYSYFFLDRTLYRPEDTISFWGFIEPFRYNEREMPDTVTVRFDSGGLDIELEVPLGENGVYTGEIELERIRSAQYAIQAELYFPSDEEGEAGVRQVVDTTYVSVKEFEKPTFVLDSSVMADYHGPDDEVKVVAPVTFYDGSPVPHLPVEASYYNPATQDWVRLTDVVTDGSGNAAFTFPASPGGDTLGESKGPRTNRYMVRIATDGESVTHVGSYTYFPSDVLLDTAIALQPDGENFQLTARAYALDMNSAALRTAMSQRGGSGTAIDEAWLLQNARGAAVDVELRIGLNWSYYDMRSIQHQNRQSSGDSGVYIQFRNDYSLDHEVVEDPGIETVDDWETETKKIAVTTRDGVAVVPDLIYLREDSSIDFQRAISLRASFSYRDGRDNRATASAYNPSGAEEEEETAAQEEDPYVVPGYSFAVTELSSGDDLTPTTEWGESIVYNAGERAEFRLLLDGEPVEEGGGRILYTVVQEGVFEYGVAPGASFQLENRVDYANEARLVAAYFDGAKTLYIKQLDIVPRQDSLRVNLEITPDREEYRPGDTVSLDVRATDYRGAGVAGNICIAVVDEAIFSLSEQYLDVLYSLYRDMNLDNTVRQYSTAYRDVEDTYTSMDGGKGSGSGVDFYDSYRSEFKDTALFYPASTDAAGSARVTFTLPDNTTSWRITAVAVGSDLRGGDAKSNIISTLPFFVKPVLTSKYIEGDDIALLVQGHGTLLSEDDEIDYTVTLSGDGTDITLAATGVAYRAMEFNFGKLDIGEYTLTARAQYSGYADTVELPLTVIKSNLELVVHRPVDISGSLDIAAMRYPVTVTLYDSDNEAFLTSINSLFGHYCLQANQRLSRFVAKRVIRQTVEGGRVPSYIAEGNDYVSDMQNADGGIAPHTGAGSDPLVTAYVLLVAKDNFDLNAMAGYFKSQLSASRDEKVRAACLLGLAAIGEAEPDDLLERLEPDKDGAYPRLDVQAYLIAALACLEETELAESLYEERLAAHVATANDGTEKEVDWDRDTAAIWIAASLLEHPDADTLSLYFGSASWRYRTLFECMIYVTNYTRKVTPTSFTYTLGGVSTTVDLGLSGMHTMVLSRSDLENLRFSAYPESLRATAYYVGEPAELGLDPSPNLRVEKSVAPVDRNTYEVTLQIHLTKDAPTGEYDLSDWVPSNSRLYSWDESFTEDERTVHFTTVSENQNLYVSFTNSIRRERTIVYTYRIRQTFQSEAALDTTYLIHGDSGENANTGKSAFRPEASDGIAVITRDNTGAPQEPAAQAPQDDGAAEEEAQEAQSAPEAAPENTEQSAG